jgi:hypothetical protein
VSCFPYDSWASHPQPAEPGLIILIGIVNGFLSQDDGGSSGEFVWEDHFKLKRVCVSHRTWQIASKFGKPEKGMKKAGKVRSESDGSREVLYRDISGTVPFRIHVRYDPDSAWVEKVAEDIA